MSDKKIDKPLVNIGKYDLSFRNISLLIILAGVLVPSVIYSINLRNPTPTELLLAICITLFASVVYLWILDATDTMRFKSEWVSKSVYGAAIVSVLGTSVAVYKDFFTDRKFPYEGKWELTIQKSDDANYLGNFTVAMNFSENAEAYWGFSDIALSADEQKGQFVWIEILEFNDKKPSISVHATLKGNSGLTIKEDLITKNSGKAFESISDSQYRVHLHRPK